VRATFLGLPERSVASLAAEPVDVAIIGIPHGVPYPEPGPAAGAALAPGAVRRRSMRLARFVDNHDFDVGGPMLPVGPDEAPALRVVDCGDVPGAPDDGPGNARRAQATVAALLAAGALPVVLGGDDSVPIPVLRAFGDGEPLTILQVDAHLDFRDEVGGVREGYSSPMRRASEMPHVRRIVQAGLRGVGSARSADVAEALAAGNLLVTARDLRDRGVSWLLAQLAPGERVFLAFDVDGLDPSVMPAVGGLAPGGLSWEEASDLVIGLAARCRVAGAAFTEYVPEHDVNERGALVVTRLVTLLVAGVARSRTTPAD
jgi:agmatinase